MNPMYDPATLPDRIPFGPAPPPGAEPKPKAEAKPYDESEDVGDDEEVASVATPVPPRLVEGAGRNPQDKQPVTVTDKSFKGERCPFPK